MGRRRLPYAPQAHENLYVPDLDGAGKCAFTVRAQTVHADCSLTERPKYRNPHAYVGKPLRNCRWYATRRDRRDRARADAIVRTLRTWMR